jgi:predicted nucleic acid-binding protein
MATFVVDASVALAWCFEDEATSWSDGLLRRLGQGDQAVVPGLWQLEVLNALIIASRRKRVKPDQPDLIWKAFSILPIETTMPLTSSQSADVLRLSVKHALTAYDAAYLELAQRLTLPLATLDVDLRRASQAEGVTAL